MTADAVAATLSQQPEAGLLMACARITPAAAQHEAVARALSGVIDWARVLDLAEAHGLLPMLFRALQSEGLPPMPRAVETRLWTHQEQLRGKNCLMSDELVAVLDLLDANGIPAVPYKGPVLAERLYGGQESREFGDLDLLLRPAHIPRARELLAQRGYAPLFPLTPALDLALLASPNHYHLALKHRIMIELHWKTDAEFPVGELIDEAWWAERATVGFMGREVLALQDRELVLALLLHGAKHLWEQINWLAELAELLRQRSTLDWTWILSKSEALRARRRVAVGLLLVRQWFDAQLPASVEEWATADGRVARLAERMSVQWFGPGGGADKGAFTRLALNLKLYDSAAQGCLHAVNVVLRPGLAEWAAWPLPRPLHALYPLIRAVRLLAKYIGAWSRS